MREPFLLVSKNFNKTENPAICGVFCFCGSMFCFDVMVCLPFADIPLTGLIFGCFL